MRRKSERNKAKSTPIPTPTPTPTPDRPRRGRPSRARKKKSSSEDEAEEAASPAAAPAPRVAPDDDESDQVWHVKASEGSGDSGEIRKLKICLSRPGGDSSPKGRKKSERSGSRGDASAESAEEKRRGRHRSRRVSARDGESLSSPEPPIRMLIHAPRPRRSVDDDDNDDEDDEETAPEPQPAPAPAPAPAPPLAPAVSVSVSAPDPKAPSPEPDAEKAESDGPKRAERKSPDSTVDIRSPKKAEEAPVAVPKRPVRETPPEPVEEPESRPPPESVEAEPREERTRPVSPGPEKKPSRGPPPARREASVPEKRDSDDRSAVAEAEVSVDKSEESPVADENDSLSPALDERAPPDSLRSEEAASGESPGREKAASVVSSVGGEDASGTSPEKEKRVAFSSPGPERKIARASPAPERKASLASPVSENKVTEASPDAERKISRASPVSERKISDASPVSERKVSETSSDSERKISGASPASERKVSEASSDPERKISGASPASEKKVSEASSDPERKISGASPVTERKVSEASSDSERKISRAPPVSERKVSEASPDAERKISRASPVSDGKVSRAALGSASPVRSETRRRSPGRLKSDADAQKTADGASGTAASRKRRWGARPKLAKTPSVGISTDSLKNIISNVEPASVEEVLCDVKSKDETESKPKRVKSEDLRNANGKRSSAEIPIDKEPVANSSHRKISIVHDDDSKLQRPPSPPKYKTSSILYITNLVRPFTLSLLKNVLQRTGRIVEGGFWIDKIKSKCYVEYENEDQAIETRHALHGVTWPVSNPKTLNVDFGSREAMDEAIASTEDDKSGFTESWQKDSLTKDMNKADETESGGRTLEKRTIVREWDLGKGEGQEEFLDRPNNRYRDIPEPEKRKRRSKSHSPSPARKFKKKEEEAPSKLLDDLFKKTKATPCIYWLPLNPDVILIKEEQRRKHMAEHERRLEELRKAEEQRMSRHNVHHSSSHRHR